MGKVYSYLSRPIRSFNIENRTERILSKDKPTPAPQYPYVKKQKAVVDQLYPNFMENHLKKDAKLDDHLKQVFVESTDQQAAVSSNTSSSRPLPQNRHQPPEYEYGVYESNIVPEGRCTLRQAIEFISKHNANPTENTVEKIAQEYKLDKQVVANILKYFAVPIAREIKRTRPEYNPLRIKPF